MKRKVRFDDSGPYVKTPCGKYRPSMGTDFAEWEVVTVTLPDVGASDATAEIRGQDGISDARRETWKHEAQ